MQRSIKYSLMIPLESGLKTGWSLQLFCTLNLIPSPCLLAQSQQWKHQNDV